MRNLTALVLFITVAGLAAADAPDISHQDLTKAIEAKSVVLIDVNGSESYAKAHIPGAIDFQAQKDQLLELLPEDKDTLIVAYCGGPKCGAWKQAAKVVQDAGYTNVKHYSAGISGWQKAQEGQVKVQTPEAGCAMAETCAMGTATAGKTCPAGVAATTQEDCAGGTCEISLAKAEQTEKPADCPTCAH